MQRKSLTNEEFPRVHFFFIFCIFCILALISTLFKIELVEEMAMSHWLRGLAIGCVLIKFMSEQVFFSPNVMIKLESHPLFNLSVPPPSFQHFFEIGGPKTIQRFEFISHTVIYLLLKK